MGSQCLCTQPTARGRRYASVSSLTAAEAFFKKMGEIESGELEASPCLVVVQGVQGQPVSVRGEHAEGGEELKHLLLHHGVGSVQSCGAS